MTSSIAKITAKKKAMININKSMGIRIIITITSSIFRGTEEDSFAAPRVWRVKGKTTEVMRRPRVDQVSYSLSRQSMGGFEQHWQHHFGIKNVVIGDSLTSPWGGISENSFFRFAIWHSLKKVWQMPEMFPFTFCRYTPHAILAVVESECSLPWNLTGDQKQPEKPTSTSQTDHFLWWI